MVYWKLFLLLSSFQLSFAAFADTILTYVHVAASDHLVVFARNRDAEFHITLSPYETSIVMLYLKYKLVETVAVRSLIIPTKMSSHGLIEIVFIGERRNSSDKFLFHAQLQQEDENRWLSVVHLTQTSIASLSSVGVECVLGIHPQDTHAFVVGDRAGYIYDMSDSLVYNWSSWKDHEDKIYPRSMSVSEDDYIIVGVYLQLVDTIYPTLYSAKFFSKGTIDPLLLFTRRKNVEITNPKASMSTTLRGSVEEGYFAMAVGLPSIDSVLLFFRKEDLTIHILEHRSAQRGVNFGRAVTLAANKTYGVLSSGLNTPPWSTGRVQVRCVLSFHGPETSMIKT